jgi:ankyrin repeat protein
MLGISPRKRDALRSTPLHFAALSGLIKNVQALIKLGAKVSAKDIDGNTPLHVAVQ